MPSSIQLCHTVKQEDPYGQTRNLLNWSIRRGVRKTVTPELPPAVSACSQGTFDLWQCPGLVVPTCCPLGHFFVPGTASLSHSVSSAGNRNQECAEAKENDSKVVGSGISTLGVSSLPGRGK